MTNYFVYYTEASVVCVTLFAIMLIWDLSSVDKQEKQIKYDRTLVAFILYFLSDALWAAVIAGVLPRNKLTVVSINFLNCVLMSAITYTWLRFVMAVEQVPNRDSRARRIAVLSPLIISTAALVFVYLFAPSSLLNGSLELQPLYGVFLISVPIVYIIAILCYTMKRAVKVKSFVERRKHLLVGLFPLLVILGGLLQMLVLPETPIFCFSSTILMLVFYIASMRTQISTDPLTGLNNRGQLLRYTGQKTNMYREGRLTVVIMLDINDFKLINDTYGHAEGDRALVLVADSFRDVMRKHSTPMFLSRYGGDEFLLLVHPTDERETEALIREIRERIEVQCRKEGVPYTVSIGAGFETLNGNGDTFQECIRRADEKLYEDKANQKKHRS